MRTTQEIIVKNVVTKNFVGTSSTQNEITQKMNSNKNISNNYISKSNNDDKITASNNNSFYKLIEKQAKEFEEFGKRMSLDLQNCYKTYLDQQNENFEVELDPTDIEKLKKYEEKFISQLQLIDSLKARIEELESESAIRDQEIKKIRREFGDFVKSNPVIPTQDNKTTTLITNSGTTFRSELSETQPSTSRNSKKNDRRNVSNKVFIHEYVDDTLLMKCKICEKVFISNKEFNKHAKQEHDIKHICFNCSEVFQEKTFLGKHIGTQHTRYCDYCDKIYNVEASLERHVKEVHLNSQDDDIDLDDEVNYTTTNVDDYDAVYLHETIQDNFGTIMKCKECEKTFNCHIKFRFHANEIHHYEWLCLVCCQVFTSRGDRARHMGQNHTQDFSCSLCTKSCYDKIGLHHHYRAKHPGEKFPYVPRQIPMTSSQSQPVITLFIHDTIPYRFPLNEKIPYQLKCKICEGLFKTHSKFNEHARTLHGYKFLCNFCSQVFPRKGAKKKHSKEVHVFTCQVCRKNFRTDDGLLSHCKAKNHYSEIREEPTFTRFGSKGPNELNNKGLVIKNVTSIGNYEENYNVKGNEFDESVVDSDDDNITIEEDESGDDESEENSDSFDDDDTEDD